MQRLTLLLLLFKNIYSANISLCSKSNSTWLDTPSRPDVVVLQEANSDNWMVKSAIADVACWIDNAFKVSRNVLVHTKNGKDQLCFKIATEPIKSTHTMIVITEGHSMSNCRPAVYGPIPNILNVRVFVDAKSDSTFTTRVDLSFHNTGGRIAVHFELHLSDAADRLKSTLQFLWKINAMTPLYGNLVPWWNPEILLPPDELQYRASREENEQLMKENYSISPVLVISCMPMLIFGIVVSCYLVIHPVRIFGGIFSTIPFSARWSNLNRRGNRFHHSRSRKSSQYNNCNG